MKPFSAAAVAAFILFAPTAQAQDSAWYDALEGLSTPDMGALMLAGQEHGTVVRIEDRTESMTPPGFRDYALFERPRRDGDACTRTYWNVTLNTMDGDVSTHSARAYPQVALSPENPCEFADFATVPEDISTEEAVAMLHLTRDFAASDRAITCSDETQSGLCRSDDYTRMVVRYSTLHRIARLEGGGYRLSMGEPFTLLEVPADESAPISIVRRTPAVF